MSTPKLPWKTDPDKGKGITIRDAENTIIAKGLSYETAQIIIKAVNAGPEFKAAKATLRLDGYTYRDGVWARTSANNMFSAKRAAQCPAEAKSYDEWRSAGFQVIAGQKSMHRRADGMAVFLPSQVKRIMSREEELREFDNYENYHEYEQFRNQYDGLPPPL